MQIRQTLEAVARAYRALGDAYREGVTAGELLAAFKTSLDGTLGTYEIVYDFLCGDDTRSIDGVSDADYVLQHGDTLLFDVSVGVGGTWCDVCRTFFVGEPTGEQQARFSLIVRTLRAGADALCKGARACDVYAAVEAVYGRAGAHLVHHAGHRIGEAPLMQPQFLPENETPLLTGACYTVESGLYEGFGIRLENDFYLDEQGALDLFEALLPLQIKEYILK